MGRTILAVIVGYLAMVIAIFATFTAAYLALGPDRSYQPGLYNVSLLWIIVSVPLGFLAALLGGLVCSRIARTPRAVKVLAIVVIVLGLALAAAHQMTHPDPGPRLANVPAMEAMSKSIMPQWVHIANPLIGAAGVLIGGRRRPAPPQI